MNSDNWRLKRGPTRPSPNEQTRTPARSYQPRPSSNNDSAFVSGHHSSGSTGNRGTFQGRSRDGLRQPVDGGKANQAIEEGRRVYVGNMPYEAIVKDVETLFRDISAGIEAINMSVDPMTGRNPSYCFIDFTTKSLADRVMQDYNGRDFMRRPLKVKPGVKSGSGTGKFDLPPRGNSVSSDANRWNRLEAPGTIAAEQGRRLFVGGLPRFESNEDCEAQIRELIASVGFEPEIVSKLVWRDEVARWDKGNNNYCFVDMRTAQDATGAADALNGLERWGGKIAVNFASGMSGKLNERKRLFVSGLPGFENQEASEGAVKDLFKDYDVRFVSKLSESRDRGEGNEGNHRFCFVELENEVQTDEAIKELDWKETWGWKIRVKLATKTGNAAVQSEKRSWGEGNRWR